MTEQEYWNELQALANEVDNVSAIYNAYEEMNELARQNPAIYNVLNSNAEFWVPCAYSLQTALIVVLSRIFDHASDAHSVHRVVGATMQHPQFFSKESLRVRKANLGLPKNLTDDLVERAWTPAGGQGLRFLKKAVAPYAKKFEDVYRPIRNQVIAHKLRDIDSAKLFSKTNRMELGDILAFLRSLVKAIEHLYLNGTEPEVRMDSNPSYEHPARRSLRKVLTELASSTGRRKFFAPELSEPRELQGTSEKP
jgi:hypothetical protein